MAETIGLGVAGFALIFASWKLLARLYHFVLYMNRVHEAVINTERLLKNGIRTDLKTTKQKVTELADQFESHVKNPKAHTGQWVDRKGRIHNTGGG